MVTDVLMPKEAGEFIAKGSKDVTISDEGVQKTALKLFQMLKGKSEVLDVDRWKLNVLNPKTADRAAVDWVFLIDCLNFSFWSETEDQKYKKSYKGTSWTGYWSLCAAINTALDEGIPITDPKYYSTISKENLEHILKSESDYVMPLFDERIRVLHETGNILLDKFDGSFTNVIKLAEGSAQKLLTLIVENFPSFRDTADFNGKKVALYKRAQIVVADIWACCSGKGFGEFHDIDTITMFADYRIPQALVWFDVLKYSDSLTDILKKDTMIPNGGRLEVEIRGCSIWAVELIVKAMKEMVSKDEEMTKNQTQMNAIIVDHFMWDYRREHATDTAAIPFHKTRCIYY